MKEIRLFPAPRDFEPSALKETQASDDAASSKKGKGGGSKYPLRRCYLDVKSGYVNFRDDSWADKSGVRTLYYSDYVRNERPDVYTFASCPRCRSGFGRGDVSTFSARGDASFFNVIGSQFHSQPSVPGKERLPNEGRKVLLFSDSRQRAAKLARDMSTTADLSAARQLFALAVKMMEEQKEVQPLQNLYGFVAYWAAKNKKIPFLRDKETAKLYDELLSDEDEAKDWGDEFVPEKKMDAAPPKMQEYALRLFCGARNTLYDTATLWLEPTKKRAKSALKLHPRSYGTSLKCLHKDLIQTNLDCDFIADMLVLEIGLPPGVDASSSWTKRAARTLAEALRKTFCKILDLDFDELVAGYRVRARQNVVDV